VASVVCNPSLLGSLGSSLNAPATSGESEADGVKRGPDRCLGLRASPIGRWTSTLGLVESVHVRSRALKNGRAANCSRSQVARS
jgi:hypothetical protein